MPVALKMMNYFQQAGLSVQFNESASFAYKSSGARQKDVNTCGQQENWQCARSACSWQKGVNDKTTTI